MSGGFASWQAQAYVSGDGNENPTFFIIQDIKTGNVVKVIDTIGTYPLRFWCNHGSQIGGGALSFTANTCGNPQASSLPDSNRYLGGPFILQSVQMQHSGVMSSDTSLAANYADTCPTSIDPQWQALGATGSNCVLMQARQPCSSYASAAEAAAFPCPWDAAKSMVSPLAPGDRFWLERSTVQTSGSAESMRVVTAPTPTGTTGVVQFWALRKSENYNHLGGSYGGSYAHPGGWSAMMLPPEARTNANVAIDASGKIYLGSYLASATHGAAGAGVTPGHYTAVGSGYDRVNGVTLPDSWGINWDTPPSPPGQFPPLPDWNIGFAGQFGGVNLGGGSMEAYASMQQLQAAPNEKRWFLDFHHMNPSNGAGAELYSAIGSMTASAVPGTSSVFRFTNYPGDHSDLKHYPPMAYAGPYLLHDISGPASAVSDSTRWAFCFVYQAGECRPGSAVGELYTSVPQADSNGVNDGQCISNWYAQLNPCAIIPFASAGWGVQYDASQPAYTDNYWRKLTQGFSGMGRQYQFGNITPVPDGTWGFVQCYWCDGVRNDVFAIQIPPFPVGDSVNRADYYPYRVPISAGAGARVKFGYAENGPANAFYCTSRQESCVTDPAVPPFAFLQSDHPHGLNCANGCTATVPAISGRVLYYQVERLDGSGDVIATNPPQMAAIP